MLHRSPIDIAIAIMLKLWLIVLLSLPFAYVNAAGFHVLDGMDYRCISGWPLIWIEFPSDSISRWAIPVRTFHVISFRNSIINLFVTLLVVFLASKYLAFRLRGSFVRCVALLFVLSPLYAGCVLWLENRRRLVSSDQIIRYGSLYRIDAAMNWRDWFIHADCTTLDFVAIQLVGIACCTACVSAC
jgi:hypothetical protein